MKEITVAPKSLEHLEAALLELEAARSAWGCWADEVRQDTEKRLDLPPCEGEEVLWADPEYGAALDAGALYSDALDAVARVLVIVDPECAHASTAGIADKVRDRRAQHGARRAS